MGMVMRLRKLPVAVGLALLAWPGAGLTATAPFHLLEASIADVKAALGSGQITCHALVDLYIKRIAAYDKSGPAINAVQIINPNALAEADRLDAAMKSSGPVGPLHCIPVLL